MWCQEQEQEQTQEQGGAQQMQELLLLRPMPAQAHLPKRTKPASLIRCFVCTIEKTFSFKLLSNFVALIYFRYGGKFMKGSGSLIATGLRFKPNSQPLAPQL
jgi:hypothetical protein